MSDNNNKNKTILNGKGHLIGRQVGDLMLDGKGHKVASYNGSSNRTVDERGRHVGFGDQRLRILGN